MDETTVPETPTAGSGEPVESGGAPPTAGDGGAPPPLQLSDADLALVGSDLKGVCSGCGLNYEINGGRRPDGTPVVADHPPTAGVPCPACGTPLPL